MASVDSILAAERRLVSKPLQRPVQPGRLRTQRAGRAPVAVASGGGPMADTKHMTLAVCLGQLDWAGLDDDSDDEQRQAQAKIYAWRSPRALAEKPHSAGERIAEALETAFGRLRPNMEFKTNYDPTADVTREQLRLQVTAARAATDKGPKRHRTLFYYCSHSRVQRPDQNALYFPTQSKRPTSAQITLADLLHYDGIAPNTIILDAPSAGSVLKRIHSDARARSVASRNGGGGGGGNGGGGGASGGGPAAGSSNRTSCDTPEFFLGSTGPGGGLANHPLLPSDIFTTCLTSPLRMAILWFIVKHRASYHLPLWIVHALPNGDDLKGELYKAFGALLDAIAQAAAPDTHDYQRLFREDMMTTHLFRHYLLAEHVIVRLGKQPCTYPQLVPTHDHHLWGSVDSLLDRVVATLATACRAAPTGIMDATASHLLHRQRMDLHEGRPTHRQALEAAAPAMEGLAPTTFEDAFVSMQAALGDLTANSHTDVTAATERLPLVFTGLIRAASRRQALQTLARYVDAGGHTALVMCERIKTFTEVLSKLWGKSDPAQWAAYLFVTAKASFADLKLIPRQVHNAVVKYCCNVLNAPVVPTDGALGSIGSIAGTRLSAACVLVALVASNLSLARQVVESGVSETIGAILLAISSAAVPAAGSGGMPSLPSSPTNRSNQQQQQQQQQQPSLLGIENGDFSAFRPPHMGSDVIYGADPSAYVDPNDAASGVGLPSGAAAARSVVDLLEEALLCLHLLTLVADLEVGVSAMSVAGRASLQALGAAAAETRRAAVRCAHASFHLAQQCAHVDDDELRAEVAATAATLAEGLLEHSKREASPLVRFELCAAFAAYLSSLRPEDVRDAATAAPTDPAASTGTLPPEAVAQHHRRQQATSFGSPGSVDNEGSAVPTLPMGTTQGSHPHSQGAPSPGPLRGSLTGIAAPTPILGSVRPRPAVTPPMQPATAGAAPLSLDSGTRMPATAASPPSLDLGPSAMPAVHDTPLAARLLEYILALAGDIEPSVRHGALRCVAALRDVTLQPAPGQPVATIRPGTRVGGIPQHSAASRGGGGGVATASRPQPLWARALAMAARGVDMDDEAASFSADLPSISLGDANCVEDVVLDGLQFLSAPLMAPAGASDYTAAGSWASESGSTSQYLPGAPGSSVSNREAALDSFGATLAPQLASTFTRLEREALPGLQARLVYDGFEARAFAFHPSVPYVITAAASPAGDSTPDDSGVIAVLAAAGDQPRTLCAFKPSALASCDAGSAGTWVAATSAPSTPRAHGSAYGASHGGTHASGVAGAAGGATRAASGNAITAIDIIDPAVDPSLLTVSGNGGIAIIGGYTSPRTVHRIAAFPTLSPEYRVHSTRCELAYQPELHYAHVSGWRAAVSTWDLERQLAVDERCDVPAKFGGDNCNALAVHRENPYAYFVGYSGAGSACLVDLRTPRAPVLRVASLKSSCIAITPARHNSHWFTTVSAFGVVRTWDDRRATLAFKEFSVDDGSVPSDTANPYSGTSALSAVSVHSCSARRPLMLAARDGRLRLFSRENGTKPLPLRGQGAVTACLWHPTKVVAAAGVQAPSGRGSAVSILFEGAREPTEDIFDF